MRSFLFFFILVCVVVSSLCVAADVRVVRDITYVRGGADDRQKLDLYLPEGQRASLPVHIYVHGGAWTTGDKKRVGVRRAKAYTDEGGILVALNYRLSPKHTHPAHVEDVAAGVKWVFDHISKYGGNPENVVLSGHSAGAHLVALLGVDGRYLEAHGLKQNMFKAIVPVDTASLNLTEKQEYRIIQKMRDKAFGTDRNGLLEASPMFNIDKGVMLSPFLLYVTGEREDAVRQNRAFAQKMQRYGHQARVSVIPKLTHKEMNESLFIRRSQIHMQVMQSFSQ